MPKRVDVDARRTEILEAAVRVFARKGFAASRIEDVAAEAGVAKGSVYLAVSSREELLTAAFDQYRARAEQQLAAPGSGPALDRLAQLIRSTVAMLAAHPDYARVLLDVWSARTPLDMAAVYEGYRAAVAELLRAADAEGQLRAGIGDAHAAVIVGAIEGCLVQWLADDRVALTEMTEPLVQVCVEGIRR
ncbi:TetR/AcrR family transcriptional regulator [Nocardia ignorata]|uniref:TetR family transcriptional regulator n=1 Tax=Nocardia ignorata TaxID=145285 RepID=A0A4R6P0M2_NOCIG|nr:TetR/AcrR family transcriptional regulator [Nocardia ignorata]TDP30715.1 TetR family transcriptional regulator [Nocardia ignorata]